MSLALYRRYRPESFADVVGQEHVTEPLMQALRTGRVNHAYLFSGPRGCGKTTSARILARCLNCEQGPTPSPCGTCPSCRDLARGGPGSLDVIEIDAASHGGVDDARDLRERVTMSPVRDRYRVYIIDEAHMVSTQGFNALLKVVEEPPEHVKFVFATTEPDKVLQTIRSRTHHYAFRLVPPDVLVTYLSWLSEAENVAVGDGVLPLVVRAGQGSVRDSLSVLDQLIAGAGADGLDYTRAVALLGYTDGALLDDVVDALGAVDGAALFGVVNRVVVSGHDPRRFVDDLLERLRDLILVQAMGTAADGVLRSVPPDQLARMRSQAGLMGAAELSRAADTTNNALTEMVGASSPRMHLELLCARLLLPAADDAGRGVGSRLDRVERRLGDGPLTPRQPPAQQVSAQQPPAQQPPAQQEVESRPAAAKAPAPVRDAGGATPEGAEPLTRASESSPAAVGGVDTERMRRSWTELLEAIRRRRRATWMILSAGAGVHDLTDGVLRLSFANHGTAKGFSAGQHPVVVAEAVRDLFNLTVRVEPYVADTRATRAAPAGQAPPSAQGRDDARPDSAPQSSATAQGASRKGSTGDARPRSPGRAAVSADWQAPSAPDEDPEPAAPATAGPTTERPEQSGPTRTEATPASAPSRSVSAVNAWGEPFGDEPPPDEPPPDEPPADPPPADRSPADPPPADPPPAEPRGWSTPAGPQGAGGEAAARPSPVRAGKAPSRYEQMRQTRASALSTPQAPHAHDDDAPSVDDPDAEDSGMVGEVVVERLLGGKVIGAE